MSTGWNMEMIGAEHSPGFESAAGSLGQTISIAGGTMPMPASAAATPASAMCCWVMARCRKARLGSVSERLVAVNWTALSLLSMPADQQVEGKIADQMTEEPIVASVRVQLGATCVECNGHDIEAFCKAFETPHEGRPLVVIARTSGATGIKPLEKPPFDAFCPAVGQDERDEFRNSDLRRDAREGFNHEN